MSSSYCPKCGAYIQEEVIYCAQCSEPLSENPFHELKSRSFLIWLLCSIPLFVVASLALTFKQSDPLIQITIAFLWFGGLIAVWGAWSLRKHNISLSNLIGKVPSGFKWFALVGIFSAIFAFNLATTWITTYLVLTVAPEYAEFILKHPLFLFNTTTSNPVLFYSLLCLYILIIGPVLEEFFFRGILFTRWSVRWSKTKAMVVSSLLFGVLHADMLGAFVFGIAMCVLYMRTKTLRIPMIVHMLFNMLGTGLAVLTYTDGWDAETNIQDIEAGLYVALVVMLISTLILLNLLRHWWPAMKGQLPYFANSSQYFEKPASRLLPYFNVLLSKRVLSVIAVVWICGFFAYGLSDGIATWHLYQGHQLISKESYSEAIGEYSKSIELNPNYALAYSSRASAYNKKRQYGLAVADLTKAIDLDHKYASAYYTRGVVYHWNGLYDLAIADLTKTIELDPNYPSAYNHRAYVYNKKGQYDLAIADYNKIIDLDPDYALAYLDRGKVYGKKGQYDLAIADFNKAIDLDPDYTSAYLDRGKVYGKKGQYDLAIADFNKAIDLDPDYTSAYLDRGKVYGKKGQYDLA
ncbi:tetratricopeptide repeat protein, partial [Chloroflexota bacterium]